MMRSWTCCNGSNPLGSLSSAPALREDPGGCESADHPKIARTAEGGACSNYLFGSGFASLGIDARALEVAVEMTFAVLVALFKQPAITAFRIGQDLPAIIVAIPKEETVGAVLEMRFGDLLEMPFFGLGTDDAVCLIHLFLGADIEPVVVEEVHPADVLAVNDGNGVGATQSNEKRDRARLNDLEA